MVELQQLLEELQRLFPDRRVKICVEGNEDLLNHVRYFDIPYMVQATAWSDLEISFHKE